MLLPRPCPTAIKLSRPTTDSPLGTPLACLGSEALCRPTRAAGTATEDQKPGQDPAVTPWRDIWQVPTLAVSIAALVIGLSITALYRPTPDYQSLLDGAERRIEAKRHVEALSVLNRKLSPLLGRESFSPEHRRRFHTLRARKRWRLARSSRACDCPSTIATSFRSIARPNATRSAFTIGCLPAGFGIPWFGRVGPCVGTGRVDARGGAASSA